LAFQPLAASPGRVHFTRETADDLPLVAAGKAAPIFVDAAEPAGVARVARDLAADIERVTGIRPAINPTSERVPFAIVLATADHAPAAAASTAVQIRGQWEAWARGPIDHPLPNVDRALVIVGSDKRGAIYGAYELSQQIGVSPWYWWADVTPDHHGEIYAAAVSSLQGSPSVKYRGIFLNDEYPDLTNWVFAKYGAAAVRENPPVPPNIANYGHEFYARLFEVLLRLRGNYLWPAMWNNAFNEDDLENARLADEYGIVMGTSHQEPMLRAQKEWDRRYQQTIGTWNYVKHPEVLEQFWREGIARNKQFESIVTMGLRGANDTEMAPGGPAANRSLLEHIVDVQRDILAQEMGRDSSRIPQLWCLYKEVQDYYEAGMRVPDDVTLLWAVDNWGNIRRLPTSAEAKRSGGAGIYYHFDYHGGPRSYQWINTSPLPKIWEQMSLAKAYSADRIWIVNVGHFKGYEVPTEFFLSLGWDPTQWSDGNTAPFLHAWAEREFGSQYAAEIADIVAQYAKFNGRRKPEMLSPHTYSLVAYREAEQVVADYVALVARAEKINAALPPAKRDAFYELVLFPTKASALVNELYLAAGRNALFAAQGRASANAMKAETERLFQADLALMDHFNHTFANGRWDHFMDQTHLGYTTWRDPPHNSLDGIALKTIEVPATGALGVSVEGSAEAWPGATAPARLPRFDALTRSRHYLEAFNRGATPIAFQATADAPWVKVTPSSGELGADTRLWVELDWAAVPANATAATITVTSGQTSVPVEISVVNPTNLRRDAVHGFVEQAGYIAIEPEHFANATMLGENRWIRIADYGRTLGGVRAEAPAHTPSVALSPTSPRLDYPIYSLSAGAVEVTVIASPTLNFVPDRGLRYAISFDDDAPQTVTLVPQGYRAQNSNGNWEKVVGDNARYSHSKPTLRVAGPLTLKIWMIDPAVVVQKVLIDFGGPKPSYLGPPESLRLP
jgi:hypothetical protein